MSDSKKGESMRRARAEFERIAVAHQHAERMLRERVEWTRIFRDKSEPTSHRLAVSELLAEAEGWFAHTLTERRRPRLTAEQLREILKVFRDKRAARSATRKAVARVMAVVEADARERA